MPNEHLNTFSEPSQSFAKCRLCSKLSQFKFKCCLPAQNTAPSWAFCEIYSRILGCALHACCMAKRTACPCTSMMTGMMTEQQALHIHLQVKMVMRWWSWQCAMHLYITTTTLSRWPDLFSILCWKYLHMSEDSNSWTTSAIACPRSTTSRLIVGHCSCSWC